MVVWMCMVGSAVSNFRRQPYDDQHHRGKIPPPCTVRDVHRASAADRGVLRGLLLLQHPAAEGRRYGSAGRHSRARLQLASGRHRGPGRSGPDDRAALVQRPGPLPPR